MYPCFYPCPITLWAFLQMENASTMGVNTDWKSLRILIFMYIKKPLNWLENKITKIEETLDEAVKHCQSKMYTSFLQDMSKLACYWACPL